MDIICPKCGEPWDQAELHDADDMTYTQAARTFTSQGCGAVFGGSCKAVHNDRTAVAEAMYDLLGDDLDGCAAMFEDWEAGL